MNPKITLAFIFCLIVVGANGQTPSPTPPPGDDGEVVKISTNLIQLDVTVTDKKGNPIRDIRPEEIEIYENGKKQNIAFMTFVPGEQPRLAEGREVERRDAVPLPVGRPKPEKIRRTIALVVDDLTLSFASTFWVRKALKKYIEEQVQDGDLVAIIRTAGGIGALQQFTSDKRQLMAAVDKIKFNMRGQSKVAVFEPIAPSLREQLSGEGAGAKDFSEEIKRERELDAAANQFRADAFAAGTLGALNYVIRGMAELPGRKSVVMLSDGFRIMTRDARGMPRTSIVRSALNHLADAANRASVVLYTLDARGVEFAGATAADDFTGMTPAMIAGRIEEREDDLSDTQHGLQYLARQTGGFAIINSNDLSWGLEKVLADQSYYLVGYSPEDDVFDPTKLRYNRIDVVVKREGARVRYRSGFIGVTDEALARRETQGAEKLTRALTSPFGASEVDLRLHTVFASADAKNAFVRSFLHIDAEDLKFDKSNDGTFKANFELVAMSFGDNGMPSEQFIRGFAVTLPEAVYQKSLSSGIVYQFDFPVKKHGAYQYRVAIRDTGTDKVGSASEYIEVPNLGNKRLSLSGIILRGTPRAQWDALMAGKITADQMTEDVERDTALRQFKTGTVLRYGAAVYGADRAKNVRGGLSARMRIFREGVVHFEGQPFAVAISPEGEAEAAGGIILGKDMPPGEYVLQIIVQSNQGGEKRSASQFVQFDIVE